MLRNMYNRQKYCPKHICLDNIGLLLSRKIICQQLFFLSQLKKYRSYKQVISYIPLARKTMALGVMHLAYALQNEII